jgi:hypothetical protein
MGAFGSDGRNRTHAGGAWGTDTDNEGPAFDCSGRGLCDYSIGVCRCHSVSPGASTCGTVHHRSLCTPLSPPLQGYSGEACEAQNALV